MHKFSELGIFFVIAIGLYSLLVRERGIFVRDRDAQTWRIQFVQFSKVAFTEPFRHSHLHDAVDVEVCRPQVTVLAAL